MTLGRENRPRERAYVYIKMEQIVFTKSKSYLLQKRNYFLSNKTIYRDFLNQITKEDILLVANVALCKLEILLESINLKGFVF